MRERLIEEADVNAALSEPDAVERDQAHGGKLLSRYLADWDKILKVAVVERPRENVLVVKTVLWSEAS